MTIKKLKSPLRKRVEKTTLAIAFIEKLGLKIEGIRLAPERVCVTLKNNSYHPKLAGIFRGRISDTTGKWCIYETTIDEVLVRWLVAQNRGHNYGLQA